MTHTQLLYLILVVAAFLIFTGSLLMATISTVFSSGRDHDADDRPGGPHHADHPS
ncbi:MAG: hypothetical protein ACREFL_14165 [Stellaceae bacterium]